MRFFSDFFYLSNPVSPINICQKNTITFCFTFIVIICLVFLLVMLELTLSPYGMTINIWIYQFAYQACLTAVFWKLYSFEKKSKETMART